MIYKVLIRETLKKVVKVDTSLEDYCEIQNMQEACQKVLDEYKDEKHVLEYEHFCGAEFHPMPSMEKWAVFLAIIEDGKVCYQFVGVFETSEEWQAIGNARTILQSIGHSVPIGQFMTAKLDKHVLTT